MIINKTLKLSIILLLSSFNSFSQAQNPSKEFWNYRIYTDNDAFAFYAANKDDNYTGGLVIDLITNKFHQEKGPLNLLKGEYNTQSLSWGFTNFTPRDIESDSVLHNDRPFSCYSFFRFGARSISVSKGLILSYRLYLGTYGAKVGEKFQTIMHKLDLIGTGRAIPKGWHNQIANGGRFVSNGNLNIEKFFTATTPNKWRFNFSTSADLNLGPVLTDVSIAPRLSFGLNGGLSQLYFPDLQVPFLPNVKKCQLEVYAKPIGRFVAWNGSLNGLWLNDDTQNKISYNELNNFQLEFEYGLWGRFHCIQAGVRFKMRSKEFSYQNKSIHHWGGFFIGGVLDI